MPHAANGFLTCMQGNIASWKKKEGDEIVAGDVLCEVETDKVRSQGLESCAPVVACPRLGKDVHHWNAGST